MRLAAVLVSAAVALAATGACLTGSGTAHAEYFCSPGFEPSYGGTCVAVAPRTEIELFVDQPLYGGETIVRHRHHHRRHGLRESY